MFWASRKSCAAFLRFCRGLALCVPVLCSPALCGISMAQAPAAIPSEKDLPALLARMQASRLANWDLEQQYTSEELWHNRNWDKNGNSTLDKTAKFENLFVEGLPYRRKVEENGKPLAGTEAEVEEKHYEQAVTERKNLSPEDKRGVRQKNFRSSLPDCCLATLFENRIVRHETIDGRDTIVVESVPKHGARPANQDEKSALNWKETFWIDSIEAMPVRMEAESLADQNHMAKGTNLRFDFVRIVDTAAGKDHPERAVWLERAFIGHLRLKMLWMSGTATTEQTWSNFKKFHVEMRLLDESIQPMPGQQNSSQQ
jgi:hypothetical protein